VGSELRQWMVVNAKGRAVTQRVQSPRLALVKAPPEAFAAADWQADSHSHMGTTFLFCQFIHFSCRGKYSCRVRSLVRIANGWSQGGVACEPFVSKRPPK
jgi:hypothetical protein